MVDLNECLVPFATTTNGYTQNYINMHSAL